MTSKPRYILCINAHGSFPVIKTDTKRKFTIKKQLYNMFRINNPGKYKYRLDRRDVPIGSNIYVDEVAPLGLINARDENNNILEKINTNVYKLSRELKHNGFNSFSEKMRKQVEDDYDAYEYIQMYIKHLKHIELSKVENSKKNVLNKEIKALSKIHNGSKFHRLVKYGDGNRPKIPIKNYTFTKGKTQQFILIEIKNNHVTKYDITQKITDFVINQPSNFHVPTSTVFVYTFNIMDYIKHFNGDSNIFELLIIDLACSVGEILGYPIQGSDFFESRSKSMDSDNPIWRSVSSVSNSKSRNSTRKKSTST